MLLRDEYLQYEVYVLKDFEKFGKDELVNKTIKLLKPYADSFDATSDAIDNAVNYGHFYMITYNLEMVGVCVIVNFRLNGFIPTYHMAYLGIDQNHQRKGIANKMVEISIEDSKGEMSLHVDIENEAAHKLYTKLGYKMLYHRYLYGREH